MASKRIKGITIEIEANTQKLTEAIKDADRQIRSASSNLKDINKLLKLDPKNTELLAQKQKALNEALEGTREKLKQEKNALEQLKNADQTDEVVRQQEALTREIADTEQQLKSLENEYKDFGSVAKQQAKAAGEATKEIGTKVQEAGRSIQSAGRELTTYVTAPIVAAGGASFMNFAEVDKTLTLANKTMGNTEEQAQLLSKAMQEAASNSTFGMNDAAQAALNFARAGLTAEEAAAAMAPAMNLAAGEGGNLDTVSGGLVATINGFHGSFEEASRYADVFAAACNNSALDVNSLSDAMSIAAPIFASAGYSIEDAALYMGAMANNGIEASVAANALKTGMARLVSPAKQGREMMEQLGISVTNADGSMKDSAKIQAELYNTFSKLSESEQIAAASAIFGKNQMASWLALINTAPDDVNKLSQALKGAAGTTENMANAMMSGTGGSIEKLKSSIDVLSYSFGELLADYVQPLIDKLQELVDKLQAMDPATKTIVIKGGMIAAAVGPVLMILGGIVVAVGKVIWAWGQLQTILGGTTAAAGSASAGLSGLGASIAGLLGPIALVAAAIAVWVHNWEEIQEAGQLLVERTKEHLETIKTDWIAVTEAIKTYTAAKWEEIKAKFSAVLEGMKIAGSMIWDYISGIFTSKIDFIKGVVEGGFGYIKDTIAAKLQAAHDFISNLTDNIKLIFDTIVNTARSWGEHLISNFLDGIKSKFDMISTVMSGAAETIKSYIHFSEPDIGPLSDFNRWMPDMMTQMAEQINAGVPGVAAAMQNVAGTMAGQMNPDYSGQLASINNGIGRLAAAGSGNITVPVYIGNQKFAQAVVGANQINNYRSGGR